LRKIFNTLYLIINTLIVAFFSFFWIGSYEQKMEVYNALPFSFIYRFLGLTAIGLTGIIVLILFNLLIDKFFSRNTNFNALKELCFQGLKITALFAFLGTTVVFFL
jgi:hypothetical protein